MFVFTEIDWTVRRHLWLWLLCTCYKPVWIDWRREKKRKRNKKKMLVWMIFTFSRLFSLEHLRTKKIVCEFNCKRENVERFDSTNAFITNKWWNERAEKMNLANCAINALASWYATQAKSEQRQKKTRISRFNFTWTEACMYLEKMRFRSDWLRQCCLLLDSRSQFVIV